MKYEIFTCDICNRKFARYSDVRGSCSVDDGTDILVYSSICRACANSIHRFIATNLLKPLKGLPLKKNEKSNHNNSGNRVDSSDSRSSNRNENKRETSDN